MKTTIGHKLGTRRAALVITATFAVAVVGCDLVLSAGGRGASALRGCWPAAALLLYGALTGWDVETLGLRLRPEQGYAYWARVTVLLGAIVLIFSAAAFGLMKLTGAGVPKLGVFSNESEIWPWLVHACFAAPLIEEGIYRFVLCTPGAVAAGPAATILLSGAAFAGLHFAYGNPSPDNLIAGFLLAWAYLKSGSILVPLVLHALGNACVFLFGLAIWYGAI